MRITPLRTDILQPPQDDLYRLLDESVTDFNDGDILVVASKLVSIHQGRCVRIDPDRSAEQKAQLINQEADFFVPLEFTPQRHRVPLTMKDGIIVGSAGIDESNGNGYFILWPERVDQAVIGIYEFLKKKHRIDKLGVVIVDTVSRPFRLGAVGLALAHFGFAGLKRYRGEKDIFGREFKLERVNVADSLATAAMLVMGEGREQQPLAIISELTGITYSETTDTTVAPPDQDHFSGLTRSDIWRRPPGDF